MARTEREAQAEERRVEARTLVIRVGQAEDACLLRLSGELDDASAPALERELDRAESGVGATLVLDLSELEFIDSTGIALLVEAARRASEGGFELKALRGSGQVERVLELTGVAELLDFLD